MVDVVTNHMGYAGCGTCVDYSVFNPFNSVRFPDSLRLRRFSQSICCPVFVLITSSNHIITRSASLTTVMLLA
jgi:hypothetical protein